MSEGIEFEKDRWAALAREDQLEELHTMVHDCITELVNILGKLERLNDE